MVHSSALLPLLCQGHDPWLQPLLSLLTSRLCFTSMQDEGGADETKFDEFLGNDAGVLRRWGVCGEEDREADNVWDQVEDRLDERRKVR